MSSTLGTIARGDALALVAAGFTPALEEIAALDPDTWRARFDGRSAPEGRGAVCRVTLSDGSRLVLRAFRRGGWLAGLRSDRLSSPTRWFDELRIHQQLHERGAPVATPAFAVAHRSGSSWSGGIATREIAPASNALEWLATQPDTDRQSAVAQAAGSALRAFHQAGGQHADLHLGNLLVRDTSPPEVFVIDLDRARAGAPPSAARRARELGRLERSLDKWLEAQRGSRGDVDKARVAAMLLRAYLDAVNDDALAPALHGALGRRRWQAALHRSRYRWSAPSNR